VAIVDRAMDRTRKTPETVLCHDICLLNELLKQRPALMGVIGDAVPGCCLL
jgi:hypothetical protein